MARLALITFVLTAVMTAQGTAQSVKILTPNDDTCVAFMEAMKTGDPKAIALGGWALGFISGVAQGTGFDFLRSTTAEGVITRLYSACQKQPGQPMSIAAEEVARELAKTHQ